MTQEELQQKCAEWQARLRLQDWGVKAKFVRRTDFGTTYQEGKCRYAPNYKRAQVQVLDSVDHESDNSLALNDTEQTLVHELLHLHFVGFEAETETPQGAAQEQAINAIAWALVKLARGGA